MANFYTRLGFVPLEFSALPASLQLKFGISHWAKILFKIPVIFMRYDRESEASIVLEVNAENQG